jgi:hypothetical protein
MLSPLLSAPSVFTPFADYFPQSTNLSLRGMDFARTRRGIPSGSDLAHVYRQDHRFQGFAFQISENNVLYDRTLPPAR